MRPPRARMGRHGQAWAATDRQLMDQYRWGLTLARFLGLRVKMAPNGSVGSLAPPFRLAFFTAGFGPLPLSPLAPSFRHFVSVQKKIVSIKCHWLFLQVAVLAHSEYYTLSP